MCLGLVLFSSICLINIVPIKYPLKTKNISTPIVPKNWIILIIYNSDFGNNNSEEWDNNISSIAVALTTSKPKILCLKVFNRIALK